MIPTSNSKWKKIITRLDWKMIGWTYILLAIMSFLYGILVGELIKTLGISWAFFTLIIVLVALTEGNKRPLALRELTREKLYELRSQIKEELQKEFSCEVANLTIGSVSAIGVGNSEPVIQATVSFIGSVHRRHLIMFSSIKSINFKEHQVSGWIDLKQLPCLAQYWFIKIDFQIP